ncbi:MAG: malate dehydrogenase [Chloroflexi bacterium]|nr:malate dehydrogenase [Chloroflexota bacterium]
MPKISVIGAGNVGATLAQRLYEKDLADVVMFDIVEGLPQGKALDIFQASSYYPTDYTIKGTNDYADTAASDVVLVTAGAARKPGMTRDELLAINASIVRGVVSEVVKHSPDCILIIISNPVDAMVVLAQQVSGFANERIMGLSGALDGARLASFIAMKLSIPAAKIEPCVIGEHGENMVVIPRLTRIDGKPLTDIMDQDQCQALCQRTIKGGAEIVSFLKTSSAFYAPSAAVARMAEAVIKDENLNICAVAFLNGQYGIKNVACGVPVVINKKGIAKIVEYQLTDSELEALRASAQAVKDTVSKIN